MPIMINRLLQGSTLAAIVLVAACSSTAAPLQLTVPTSTNSASSSTNIASSTSIAASTSSNAPTVTEAEPTVESQPSSVSIPDSPAGAQLTWVLDESLSSSDEDFTAHFAPSFIDLVPIEELRSGIAAVKVIAITEIVISEPNSLVVIADSDAGKLAISINVDPQLPHQIVSLNAQPAELPAAPTSWEAVDSALAVVAPQTALLAAEVATDGTLTTIRSTDSDASVPLGSSFKLYVLGTLLKAIEAGTIKWDDQLTITDELKSLPSGEFQDLPSGSKVTVQEAAEKMIQISDNTATDILIDRLGRDAVESTLSEMGMREASRQRTLPFMTTKELFTLKWGLAPDAFAAYASSDIEHRRQTLTEIVGMRPDLARFDDQAPIGIDTVEWFATPAEIAAAHIWLDVYRKTPGFEPVSGILGTNPGVPVSETAWAELSFKGGSEPGVVFVGWLLHRNDGRRFVAVVSATNPNAAVGDLDVAAIAQGVINLLALAP